MPFITVTDAGNKIPAHRGRKQLIIRASADVRFGWESTTTWGGATRGVLLVADSLMAFGGKELDLQGELHLRVSTGQTAEVEYTEKA